MIKIDRVEDLPEWFDLEKYKPCETFGAAEWLHELGRRAELIRFHPDYMGSFEEQGDVLHELISELWRASTEVNSWPLRQSPVDLQGSAIAEPALMPVRAVLTMDLLMQTRRDEIAKMEGKCGDEKVNRWAAIGDPRFPMREGVRVARVPIEIDDYTERTPPRPVIQVDLSATDSVLLNAFGVWLKEARARQPVASKRERQTYKDWARYGLLPYLDLLIWAMETSSQIPHHVMAQAVGYRKGGDSFRKTVPKLAVEMMRSLAELEALAAIEAVSEKFRA